MLHRIPFEPHEKLAETLGFEFKEVVTSSGLHVIEGIYHIQHVNSYDSLFLLSKRRKKALKKPVLPLL